MTDHVALFCKSFAQDFDHLGILLGSFAKYNCDNVTLTISLPESDISSFKNKFGENFHKIRLISDESYGGADLSTLRGWHAQQVCKLRSWRIMEADHFAVIDSDCYFIRPFTSSDFAPKEKKAICCGSSVRTVLKSDNTDLIDYINGTLDLNESKFPRRPNVQRDSFDRYFHFKDLSPDDPNAIQRSDIPFRVFNSTSWMFFQPGQIFSSYILQSFEDFLDDRGASVADAIKISPWEYNWYGEFAAAVYFDDTEFRVSPFLHLQSDEDVVFARENGFSEHKLSAKFPLIAMAARHVQMLKLDESV